MHCIAMNIHWCPLFTPLYHDICTCKLCGQSIALHTANDEYTGPAALLTAASTAAPAAAAASTPIPRAGSPAQPHASKRRPGAVSHGTSILARHSSLYTWLEVAVSLDFDSFQALQADLVTRRSAARRAWSTITARMKRSGAGGAARAKGAIVVTGRLSASVALPAGHASAGVAHVMASALARASPTMQAAQRHITGQPLAQTLHGIGTQRLLRTLQSTPEFDFTEPLPLSAAQLSDEGLDGSVQFRKMLRICLPSNDSLAHETLYLQVWYVEDHGERAAELGSAVVPVGALCPANYPRHLLSLLGRAARVPVERSLDSKSVLSLVLSGRPSPGLLATSLCPAHLPSTCVRTFRCSHPTSQAVVLRESAAVPYSATAVPLAVLRFYSGALSELVACVDTALAHLHKDLEPKTKARGTRSRSLDSGDKPPAGRATSVSGVSAQRARSIHDHLQTLQSELSACKQAIDERRDMWAAMQAVAQARPDQALAARHVHGAGVASAGIGSSEDAWASLLPVFKPSVYKADPAMAHAALNLHVYGLEVEHRAAAVDLCTSSPLAHARQPSRRGFNQCTVGVVLAQWPGRGDDLEAGLSHPSELHQICPMGLPSSAYADQRTVSHSPQAHAARPPMPPPAPARLTKQAPPAAAQPGAAAATPGAQFGGCPVAVAALATAGIPAAHSLGFKTGGLLQHSKKFANLWTNLMSHSGSPEHCARSGSIGTDSALELGSHGDATLPEWQDSDLDDANSSSLDELGVSNSAAVLYQSLPHMLRLWTQDVTQPTGAAHATYTALLQVAHSSVQAKLLHAVSCIERETVVVSQALSIILTAVLQRFDMAIQAGQHELLAAWATHGMLVELESLVSTVGAEVGMLQDCVAVMQLLSTVQLVFKAAPGQAAGAGSAKQATAVDSQPPVPPSAIRGACVPPFLAALSGVPTWAAWRAANAMGTARGSAVPGLQASAVAGRSISAVLSEDLLSKYGEDGTARSVDAVWRAAATAAKPGEQGWASMASMSPLGPGLSVEWVPSSGHDVAEQAAGLEPGGSFRVCVEVPAPLVQLLADDSPTAAAAKQATFTLIPLLFTMGINETQAIAEAMSVKHRSIQQACNVASLQTLQAYMAAAGTTMAGTDLFALQQELLLLRQDVLHPAGKQPRVLHTAASIVRGLGGARATCCKSGKDRTGMASTLELADYLRSRHDISKTEAVPAEQAEYSMLDLLRACGVRRDICQRNVGRAVYAFNALQLKFTSRLYRAPISATSVVTKSVDT